MMVKLPTAQGSAPRGDTVVCSRSIYGSLEDIDQDCQGSEVSMIVCYSRDQVVIAGKQTFVFRNGKRGPWQTTTIMHQRWGPS